MDNKFGINMCTFYMNIYNHKLWFLFQGFRDENSIHVHSIFIDNKLKNERINVKNIKVTICTQSESLNKYFVLPEYYLSSPIIVVN